MRGKKPPDFRNKGASERMFHRRAFFLGAAQIGAGAVLAGRMAWLSIAEGERYAVAAEDNRVTLHRIVPRRGWIVDAAGETLANNRPAYGVEIIPSLAGDLDRALDRIATVVPLTAEDRERIHAEALGLRPSAALLVADDIGWKAYAALNLDFTDVAGVQAVKTYVRNYPDSTAFAHLLGYVGPPTAEQYKQDRDPLYMLPGFRVGKDGVEKCAEKTLRGEPGARRVEVNARGRIVRELDTRDDIPGQTVQLTIDRGLQAFTAARVGDESCSVVVLDCLTGDIKCLLSMPAFDPNIFSNRIPSKLWKEMQADEKKPLLNKVMQGLYVPGSTFKPVTALAALASGVPPTDTVFCGGRYTVGGRSWHCHRRSGHGTVAMRDSISKSCNVYFYSMAHRIGAQAVADMARTLGLEHKFDLPMPVQRAGIIPDPAWKQKRYDQRWTAADTLNMSIGQGYVVVNPLQLAVMTARIATGQIVEPRLLAGPPPAPFERINIPPEHLDVVRAGMDDVVNGSTGTARASRLKVPGIAMAGKTGTAQVRSLNRGGPRGTALPWRFRDHALFIAFAPVEAPRYAVSVIVEHGMGGSRAAAPIAKDVLTWIYDRELAEESLEDVLSKRAAAERVRIEAERRAAAEAAATAPSAP
ncbi:MAG: penicillin-binding protein 2 [Sphingomonadaceae bacterium]